MSAFLASPVWDDSTREITQPFGPTTLTVEPWWPAKNCFWHCGVDIGMPVGVPLKAARAGQVKRVAYGELIILVSATESDCYIHIDRACVVPGQSVVAGQLVAYSGAKVPAGGFLTGPHLHFEVQTGTLNTPATSLDPIPVLEDDMFTPADRVVMQSIHDRLSDEDGSLDAQLQAAVVAGIAAAGLTPSTGLTPTQVTALADAIVTAIKNLTFKAA